MQNSLNKKTKVCHIIDELRIGGAEKTVIAIVLNLKRYLHEVWCLKQKGMLAEALQKEGIKVKEFNFAGGIKLSSIVKLARELKKQNFNIVHCHEMFPSMWGRIAAIFAGVPIKIVHAQNLYYKVSRKDRFKLKFLSLFTTKIIAVSEAVKRCLIEFIGVNPKKITVVYNSAPDLRVTAGPDLRAKLRQTLGINEEDFLLGGIGRLEERKGYAYLIEAMDNLFKGSMSESVNCKCIIVGDGLAREDLEFKAKHLGLADKVIFTGYRRNIENLLLIMEIFIQPSILIEGLPLALAEAASAGLPLIATDIGGNPEIVKDNVNGFVIPARDSGILTEKIKYLIDNPQERKRMGENSRKIWQEKFTLDEMIKKIGDLYAQYV